MKSDIITYALELYTKGYIKGPKLCRYGGKIFHIYKDSKYKINQCSFSCANYK